MLFVTAMYDMFANVEPLNHDEQPNIFRILENTTPNKYQPKPNGHSIPQNTQFRKYAKTPTFDVCDLMDLAICKYVCCFSEFLYFLILDSIGYWLIFECCSHLQNRPRSFFKGSWRVE